MRHCYLVCYDIREEKRLRRVHKTMKAWGVPWQFSVFFCILRSIDRVRMQTALEEILNLKQDSVLIIDMGTNEEAAEESAQALGVRPEAVERGVVVI